MMDAFALLWGTLVLRPYIFVFLAVHCWSAGRVLGPRRAAALTGIVWAAALAAEWASTRVGFPFGYSAYAENTRGRELFLGNVPSYGPLSFPYLAWAAYALAVTCFVLNDVIIDPLAVREDRWFPGKIFEYPPGGAYFGVPLSNFVGWVVELLPGRAARAWQRETSHP